MVAPGAGLEPALSLRSSGNSREFYQLNYPGTNLVRAEGLEPISQRITGSNKAFAFTCVWNLDFLFTFGLAGQVRRVKSLHSPFRVSSGLPPPLRAEGSPT